MGGMGRCEVLGYPAFIQQYLSPTSLTIAAQAFFFILELSRHSF